MALGHLKKTWLAWGAASLACLLVLCLARTSQAQQSSNPEATPREQPPVLAENEVRTAAGPDAPEVQLRSRIAGLIEQLGDANYHRRQSAKWELERIGLAAFEQLRQAAQGHPSAQVALAARYLIDSQNVVWWLETDSLEVRDLLTTYNDSSQEDRDTVLQQLSERGTPDALLALCRLARFESNEQRSKSAALYLMQTISEQVSVNSSDQRGRLTAQLPASIHVTLGDSNRPASQWLLGLMEDLRVLTPATSATAANPEATQAAPQLPIAHVVRWRELIAQEHAEIPLEPSGDRNGTAMQFERFRSIAVTLRFYRWLGSWLTEHRGRREALDAVRASVQLISSHSHALQTAAEWSLEAKLPELVIELAKVHPEQFAEAPELGYFLAEGYLRLGDEEAAQRVADDASDSVLERLTEKLRNFGNLDLEEIQANQHYQLARSLAHRGMNQWAEQEFLRALPFKSRLSEKIRTDLAQFYWFGSQHQKAAEVLEPLAKEFLDSRDRELPTAPGEQSNPEAILANYYFYRGLAALDSGEKAVASEYLRKCVEVEHVFPNPDAVIAMRQLATEEPFASYYREQLDHMSKSFRIRVLQAEEQLSRAVDRMSRAMAGPTLATECNQLAWLLSKCEVNPEEALNLSLRSLELSPDDPTYLDTLARCYFALGQVENAVRIQKRAIQLAPHERLMAAQLTEFETALAAQKASE